MPTIPDSPVSEILLVALNALDPAAAHDAIESHHLRPDDVLATYHRLQSQYREGLVGLATVAAATSLSRQLLIDLIGPAVVPAATDSGPRRDRIVVASPPGEAHLLYAEAAAATLRAEGWPVDLLCGAAGHGDLALFLRDRPAMAVVVVCTLPATLPAAARALGEAHRAAVPVVLSGPAFGSKSDDLRPLRLGADAWAPDLTSMVDVLRRWATVRPVPDVGGGLPEEYLRLEQAVLSNLQGAYLGGEGTDDRRLLRSLFEHLEAAVLVDDGRILLDFVRAELSARQHRGDDEMTLVRLVDAVSLGLPEGLVRSSAFVDDGKRYLLRVTRPPVEVPAAPASQPMPTAGGGEVALRPVTGSLAQGSAQGTSGAEGRVFSDLLMLGAMACEARTALVSVQRDGRWSTLSYGAERGEEVGDPVLLEMMSTRQEPVEISDLTTHPVLSSSTLSRPPLDVRWLLGVPLRDRDGGLLGVMCILDRRRKVLSKSQGKAVLAIARQLESHLAQWRRPVNKFGPSSEVRPAPVEPLSDRPAPRRGAIDSSQQLLRSHEVASLFDVTERTVINWAASGKLPALRTIGGHLRFRSDDVASLLDGRPSARSG